MTDYKNGKIYAIKSNETDEVYIGSTCATLKTRLINHKSAFKTGKKRIGEAKKLLKYADAYIELIEEYPCESKRELLDKEGEIIRITPNCVNIQIQGRTMSEWRVDNAEKIKQYSKEYHEKNRERQNEKHKQWYYSDKGRAYLEKVKEERKLNRPPKIIVSEEEKKEKKKEQNAKYRLNNSEKIKATKNRKLPCPQCGKEISAANLSRHINTQHKKNITK